MQITGLVDGSQVLHLPLHLQEAYREELISRGLLTEAEQGSTSTDIHGGISDADTLRHFTHRFANSASRLVCLLVDPGQAFATIPNAVWESFSSHKIAVLDAPCGAGASLLSLLNVIVAAREHQLLPQLPLEVGVIAADISPKALEIYSSLVSKLAPHFAKYGIQLNVSTHIWDAGLVNQTSMLCDELLFRQHSDANEYFVLVSNLSGVGAELEESFRRSFEHVTERISNVISTVLWIEPAITKTFFAAIKRIFSLSTWLNPTSSSSEEIHYRFQWQQPVLKRVLKGSVMVQQYDRKTSDNSA